MINPASRRVLEKSGFRAEGSFLKSLPARGGLFPCEQYRLDRSTWAALKSWGASGWAHAPELARRCPEISGRGLRPTAPASRRSPALRRDERPRSDPGPSFVWRPADDLSPPLRSRCRFAALASACATAPDFADDAGRQGRRAGARFRRVAATPRASSPTGRPARSAG